MVPGYYRPGLAVALGLLMLVVSIMTLQPTASAQCGVECWETPTPPPTATDFVPGTGTPTPVEMPATVVFGDVDYENPTSIPLPEFPDSPDPNGIQLTPFAMPSPFAPEVTIEAFQAPVISTPTAIPLTLATPVSQSAAFTAINGIINDATGIIGDVVSYTTYLSGVVETINPTGTFTLATAPAWYAPELPRPMADIGWTFEQLGQDETARYSYAQWGWFVGYMASLPFQLIKSLWQLILFAGPLGLFLAWLMVMLPIVAFIKFFNFIKNLFISLINFVIKVIRFIGDILELIPGY